MPRKAKAALCRAHNTPVVVESVAVDPPKRGEVTVKLGACGVCHSDLSAINGTIALPLPLVLGHEGAGVVEEVGEGVAGLAPGDHVVFSFIYMCGKCRFCAAGRPVLCLEQGKALTTPLEGTPRVRDARGEPLGIFSGCGAMAEYATVSAENLIRIDAKHPARLRGARRLRRHHRRGRGLQHRARRAGLLGGGIRLRRRRAVGDPGRANRRRGSHHRDRHLAAEARHGEEVRRDRHGSGNKRRRSGQDSEKGNFRRPRLRLRMRRLGRARRRGLPRDPPRRPGGGRGRGQAGRRRPRCAP